VGKIIPGVEAIIVDPETQEILSQHKIGELCVRGDSVFKGYYKQDNSTTFIDVGGKKYYKTGDLAYLDDDNYLYLQGRLKLSFKKGGEMISVAAIEAALFEKAKEKGWVSPETTRSPFACIPKEVPQGAPKVVLFSEINLALDQVNAALLETGFSRLYKVNEVIVLDEIPLLKTGKVCYRKLFEMLSEKSPTKIV
jgi:acyl-CoA synthetase (AMP-forming)/AMP-acid ligase II